MLRKGIFVIGLLGIVLGYTLKAFATEENPAMTPPSAITSMVNALNITRYATASAYAEAQTVTINPNKQSIALTFDDGPDPRYTPQILDILDKYNVKATFFMVGENAKKHPKLVKEVLRRGHTIGNHTLTHPILTHLSVQQMHQELMSTNDILIGITGKKPACFRPPYGATTKSIDNYANSLGLQVVLWDVSSNDYLRRGALAIENKVLKYAHPGYVVLMHDGGGNRSQTVTALPTIIEGLKKRGLSFDQIC